MLYNRYIEFAPCPGRFTWITQGPIPSIDFGDVSSKGCPVLLAAFSAQIKLRPHFQGQAQPVKR